MLRYRMGSISTLPCDKDVETICIQGTSLAAGAEWLTAKSGVVHRPYGQCLMGQNLTSLSSGCRRLVTVMAKQGEFIGGKLLGEKLPNAISWLAAEVRNPQLGVSVAPACLDEVDGICENAPLGPGAVVECLREKVDDPGMGPECRSEVAEKRPSANHAFNRRICFYDIQKACVHACDKAMMRGSETCAESVLRCFSENRDGLVSQACSRKISLVQKVSAEQASVNAPLQSPCRAELQIFCPKAGKDHARTLACLRSNHDRLSESCRVAETRYTEMEASDIRLTPTLMNVCGRELQFQCKDVPPSGTKVFECLQSGLSKGSAGSFCRAEISFLASHNDKPDARLAQACCQECEFCPSQCVGNLAHDTTLPVLIREYTKVSDFCQAEVVFAVRSAMLRYRMGGNLTWPCDSEVIAQCQSSRVKQTREGSIGRCLMGLSLTSLNSGCRRLVKVTQQREAYVGGRVNGEKIRESINDLVQEVRLTLPSLRNYEMRSACLLESEDLCENAPLERTIQCLEERVSSHGMGLACKSALTGTGIFARGFYGNWPLQAACKADFHRLCPHVCNFSNLAIESVRRCADEALKCLGKNLNSTLSMACKDGILALQSLGPTAGLNMSEIIKFCGEDFARFSRHITPLDVARDVAWLLNYYDSLLPSCASYLLQLVYHKKLSTVVDFEIYSDHHSPLAWSTQMALASIAFVVIIGLRCFFTKVQPVVVRHMLIRFYQSRGTAGFFHRWGILSPGVELRP